LSEICKVNFENDTALSFQDLLKQGVMENREKIRDIVEIATKEQSFEKVF